MLETKRLSGWHPLNRVRRFRSFQNHPQLQAKLMTTMFSSHSPSIENSHELFQCISEEVLTFSKTTALYDGKPKAFIGNDLLIFVEDMKGKLLQLEKNINVECKHSGILLSQSLVRTFAESIEFIHRSETHFKEVFEEISSGGTLDFNVFRTKRIPTWLDEFTNHIQKLSGSLVSISRPKLKSI